MRSRGCIRKTAVAVVLATTAMALGACGGLSEKGASAGGGSDEFVIGLATPKTGDFAEIGQDSERGARMALEEINKAGGFAGHKGKLVVEDDGGEPATGVNAVARLTQRDGAEFLLGPDLSTITLAALPTAESAQIPELTSSISPAIMEKGDEWLFRARPSDATNARIMVRYGVETLKLKRIALLYGLDAYGQGALPTIKSAAKKMGANLVLVRGVPSGTKDTTAQVTAAKRAHADGILWWGLIPESAVLEKDVKRLGFSGPLFGANALVNESTIRLAGDAADGAIAATTFVVNDPDPQVKEFVARYKDRYGRNPNDHAPLYYDMVQAVARAAEAAKSTDPAKMRDAMRSISYDAITGTMKWNQTGEFATESAVIVKIKNGEPKVVGRGS